MIKVVVTGTDQVIMRFQTMSERVRAALRTTITGLLYDLQGYVVRSKLSGQVLRRVTGNLASSINVQLNESEAEIGGQVGTKVIYGGVHEYGGDITIPAHTRTISQVFGRPITPTQQFVREHVARFPERSFLRSSLRDKASQIRDSIEKSVRATMAEV